MSAQPPSIPIRPRCAACPAVMVVDFAAPRDIWLKVAGPFADDYLCISCFASRADEKGIDWAEGLKLMPLTLVDQLAAQARVAAGDWSNARRPWWERADG